MAPLNTASHLELQQTEASRQGVKYVAASGHRIANKGQRKTQGLTDEGLPLGITWQVADVKKPLASIGRMCDAGNVALFTKQGGYVVPHASLEKVIQSLESQGRGTLKMRRENGVYSFNMWMPKPPKRSVLRNQFAALDEESVEDFQRLGKILR